MMVGGPYFREEWMGVRASTVVGRNTTKDLVTLMGNLAWPE